MLIDIYVVEFSKFLIHRYHSSFNRNRETYFELFLRSAHSVLSTRQRHHSTAFTAGTLGPQTVRCTKYRTEKITELNTKALKTLFGAKFWVNDVTKDDFFGLSGVTPRRFFSTTVSDVTVADCPRFHTSPRKVLFPGEINPKIKIFYWSKKEKQKSEICHLLSKLFCHLGQYFFCTCRSNLNGMKNS